jgi:hypothetical protein
VNTYLEQVRELGVQQGGDPLQQLVEQMRKLREHDYNPLMMRDTHVRRWAWAVPNDAALDAIAALSPIVEVGAGGGYWAKLLRERGATIDCYDAQPYPLFNYQVARSHVAVAKGGPERALRHHPDRTLLLCWPSYANPWAEQALELHRGEHVAYVGEGPGGCTGTDHFHELLDELCEEVQAVEIPQWPGLHDWLSIWRRRGS